MQRIMVRPDLPPKSRRSRCVVYTYTHQPLANGCRCRRIWGHGFVLGTNFPPPGACKDGSWQPQQVWHWVKPPHKDNGAQRLCSYSSDVRWPMWSVFAPPLLPLGLWVPLGSVDALLSLLWTLFVQLTCEVLVTRSSCAVTRSLVRDGVGWQQQAKCPLMRHGVLHAAWARSRFWDRSWPGAGDGPRAGHLTRCLELCFHIAGR